MANKLTRVGIIDYESGIVVYDKLVKPPRSVIDSLTKYHFSLLLSTHAHHGPSEWSGITEASLVMATTTLAEVQTQLLAILVPKDEPTSILIGSLESDLKALRVCHPLCNDTALIYHHPCGRPLKPGLAWLTKKWCQREVQMRARVDLFRLKIQTGADSANSRPTRRTSLSAWRGRCENCRRGPWSPGRDARRQGVDRYRVVLDGLTQAIPAHDFWFGRFTGIADAMGCECPSLVCVAIDRTTSRLAPAPSPNPNDE
jgi:RNA exonuclease 1